MARSIDSKSAKKLIETHKALLHSIDIICAYAQKSLSDISVFSKNLIKYEAENTLNNIPVEELNRDKKGIRVKTLRDSGYKSIADIEKATASKLSGINGISLEAAVAIKKISSEISKVTLQSTHLKLSADNKNPASTELVKAISKFLKLNETTDTCKILSEKKQDILNAIKVASPLTSGIKWLFTTKAKKESAEEAYDFLLKLSQGEYGIRASDCDSEFKAVSLQTKDSFWEHFQKEPVRFFNVLEEAVPHLLESDDTLYGLPEELAKAVQDEPFYSEGLKCTLRRYQEWGVKYTLHQKKVLLGDEMGLGKTVQAIACMVSLKNTGGNHFVVVCPASVLTNWCREIEKMSDLAVTKVHGANRSAALQYWKENGGVAVTTYETTEHFNLGPKFRFSMLVVDEAHYIKNPKAQRTANVKNICTHSDRLMFMTGTALENRVTEMVELIKILQPSIAQSVHGMEFLSSAPEFKEKVAPVYYRRRREDVLTELPELIENKEWCTLNEVEEKKYEEAVLSQNFANARRVSWHVDDIRYSTKANRMLEIIEEAKEDNRKIIVFSFFLNTIEKVCNLLGSQCMEPINGSVPPNRRQEIIDEFEKAPAGTVLAAQIQSGGTGLNIQSASVVIICEPQFKPSIENQAISRAYRMGQTRNVLVHRLLSDETVDERITDLLEEKQKIFDAFADESVVATESLELDEKSFAGIMEEEQKRIEAKNSESEKSEEDTTNSEKSQNI